MDARETLDKAIAILEDRIETDDEGRPFPHTAARADAALELLKSIQFTGPAIYTVPDVNQIQAMLESLMTPQSPGRIVYRVSYIVDDYENDMQTCSFVQAVKFAMENTTDKHHCRLHREKTDLLAICSPESMRGEHSDFQQLCIANGIK